MFQNAKGAVLHRQVYKTPSESSQSLNNFPNLFARCGTLHSDKIPHDEMECARLQKSQRYEDLKSWGHCMVPFRFWSNLIFNKTDYVHHGLP